MTATTSIQDSCARLLTTLRKCNLNYSCQETPYSIYLTVRKSWSKHQQIYETVELFEPVLQSLKAKEEILLLKTELDDVTAQHEACRDILAAHKDAAAAEVITHHKEMKKLVDKKDDEIKSLKASIKNRIQRT